MNFMFVLVLPDPKQPLPFLISIRKERMEGRCSYRQLSFPEWIMPHKRNGSGRRKRKSERKDRLPIAPRSEYVIFKNFLRVSERDWRQAVMERTFVSVAVQTDACEFDLSELSSAPLGRPWPREDEDTSHIQHGYYRRYDGMLGKVKNGIKLTESEDSHSSSQSAKRARYDPDDVSSSQESMLQKCETCGHEWNDGSQCEHSILKQPPAVETFDDRTTDDEEEGVPQYDMYRCNNTFMKDGQEIQCDGETNANSQLCHSCLQCVKKSYFA